jgi:DNA-directed RNA polymerase subunit alpha
MKENLEFISLVEISEDNFGKFLIKPLDTGMGISVGNIFRRLLLTQITGTNITGVRIANITNEFSTIAGVREDVIEILLNLRQVILKGWQQEKTYARLKIQGPAIITASSIQLDSLPNITIINPNQYIATIMNDAIIEMEFKIESGKDYSLATNQTIVNSSDFLTVDKISSPIRQVVFEVDDKLASQNYEELILKVWTDGSITPSEAIIDIAAIIQKFFTQINLENLKTFTNFREKNLL